MGALGCVGSAVLPGSSGSVVTGGLDVSASGETGGSFEVPPLSAGGGSGGASVSGAVAGVMVVDVGDGSEVPLLLLAVTVNV
ncbi:MAG: hypothetical protein CMH41_09760 [Micrococcales bacterium]|nr:hypothetical protein [Micrococcales bacterium]